MDFTRKLEFGNYTLKFGEENVLLDLFEEVVMPSFHEMKFVRTLKGKGDYFFLDTKLINLGEESNIPVLGISGRIVKNTKLKRDQIFRKDGGLIEDKSELETAPSSTFLLILNNHRLILCKEVQGAPSMQNFQSTSQFCLKQQYEWFINDEYERSKLERQNNPDLTRVTKKSLVEKHPYPTLRITPLSDKQSLKDFVERLEHIDRVSIRLLPTNKEEIDNDDFWSEFGRRREAMNSRSARVEFSNPKDGLDSDEVYEQANSASGLGNSEVKLKGYDEYGDTINGTNEDFSLTVALQSISRDPEVAARAMYRQFKDLVSENVIKLPVLLDGVVSKITNIFRGL
ncbi:hypothetical protein [Thalassolituus sp. UBA2009]|uniref:hypothetical protein n=1 Tax=Thalassolituus sp. UBA2009 TaxID=1947658 RepID=UPI00258066DA|nr:hypothetical protein [Thalassolituus sp. UBA2009]